MAQDAITLHARYTSPWEFVCALFDFVRAAIEQPLRRFTSIPKNSNWYHPGDSIDLIDRKWNKCRMIGFMLWLVFTYVEWEKNVKRPGSIVPNQTSKKKQRMMKMSKSMFATTPSAGHSSVHNVIMLSLIQMPKTQFPLWQLESYFFSVGRSLSLALFAHSIDANNENRWKTTNKKSMTAQLKLSLHFRSDYVPIRGIECDFVFSNSSHSLVPSPKCERMRGKY